MSEKLNPKIVSVESEYSDADEQHSMSISRVNDAKCPYQYFKNHIQRPKEAKPFESIELGLGQFFHSTVERLFRQIKSEQRPIENTDNLAANFVVAAFREDFLFEGKLIEPYRIIKSDQNFPDFEKRLSGIVKNFNKFLLKELIGHRIVESEGRLQITMENCFIRGKYDLITKRGDALILWDWKTGKEPNPRFLDSFHAQKNQIALYAVWMKHYYKVEDVKGSSVYLRGKLAWLSEMYDLETEKKVLKYMLGWRDKLNQLLVYPQKQSILCQWCPWNQECKDKRTDRPF